MLQNNMSSGFLESSLKKNDPVVETPLRPQTLIDFVGQENVRKKLEIVLTGAKSRNEALGHCLLSGPPGLGKTTLAHIVAKAMSSSLVVTSGPALEKAGDLAGLLTNLQKGDVLFIDEIHRLSKVAEEYLYPAMEDYVLDLMIDTGPNARSVKITLNRFTLIGATTRSGLLSGPMRSRFPLTLRLDYYEPPDLQTILMRSARLLQMKIDPDAALLIAQRARGTPRIANNLLLWIRDFACARNVTLLGFDITKEALEMLAIDEKGLEEMDKKILTVMIDHHGGGPVGLKTLAAAVGEEPDTLEEVYEPYLILQGFVKRTPRGRQATTLAYQHMKGDHSCGI